MLQVLYRAVNYQMEPEDAKSEPEADETDSAKVCAASSPHVKHKFFCDTSLASSETAASSSSSGVPLPPPPLLALIHFVCFPVAPYLMRCKSSVKVVHLSFGLFMPPTLPSPPPPTFGTDGFMAPWVGVNVSWLASHPLCARTGARLKLSLVTLLLCWCLNSSPVCI